MDLNDQLPGLADSVLDGTEGGASVAIGPVSWREDEHGARVWYFVTAAANTAANLHIIQIKAGADPDLAADMRFGLSVELLRRRPIVVHDFDSELGMARFMVVAWPSERTRRLSAAVAAEQESWQPG